jgi:hypothetical protein
MIGAEELKPALQKAGSGTSSERSRDKEGEGEKRTSIMRLRLDKARGHLRCWRGPGGLSCVAGQKEGVLGYLRALVPYKQAQISPTRYGTRDHVGLASPRATLSGVSRCLLLLPEHSHPQTFLTTKSKMSTCTPPPSMTPHRTLPQNKNRRKWATSSVKTPT